MSEDLVGAMSRLEEEKTLALVKEKLEAGVTAMEIVEQCRRGIEVVGSKYGEGVFYLSDLIMSEEIFRRVMEILEPHFPQNDFPGGAKIIMGTIEGDIHDLGKQIVVYLLRSSGFKVYDLGVDVPPEKFVEAVKETGASIIGICVLLTYCIGSVKKVVDLLVETGLKEKVTVVLGGYPVNAQVRDYTGVDYYGNDALHGLEIFKKISGETNGGSEGNI
jgi:methylmalonyl-CoA mutase cobalamin-binding domain/chain